MTYVGGLGNPGCRIFFDTLPHEHMNSRRGRSGAVLVENLDRLEVLESQRVA